MNGHASAPLSEPERSDASFSRGIFGAAGFSRAMVVCIVALAAVLAAAAAGWFAFSRGGAVSDTRFESAPFGVSFGYRADDFAFRDATRSARGDKVASWAFDERAASADFFDGAPPREGPPGITLEVFRNRFARSADAWAVTHPGAQFHLARSPLRIEVIAGRPFAAFTRDGLYLTDVFVTEHAGYIYVASVAYNGAADPVRAYFAESFLPSLRFFDPAIPASMAHGDIRVSAPDPQALVSSPLTVSGEARGSWFFEASFPIALVDGAGRTVAEHYAMAVGDWMTDDFVPFSAEIALEKPPLGARGTLILRRDNPSGLPEMDDAIEVPVRFE